MRVTLSESQQMGALTVRNDGTEPVSMQLKVLNWSQEAGKDVLTPSRELLANPPIFTVPAGGSQLVRVGLRRAPDGQRELTYRIALQELPPPLNSDFMGTRMLMRISLPVFVLPEVDAKPVLRWQATRTSQGGLKVSLTNNGNAHIQIKNFKLSLVDSTQPWVTKQSAEYVLPGQSRDWNLRANAEYPAPLPGVTLQLFAQTDAGDIEAEVIIGHSTQPWVTKQSAEYVLPGQSRDWNLRANAEYPAPLPGVTLQLFAQTDAGDIEAEVMIAP